MRSGQPDVIPMPAGQIIGRMTEVRPVADVMATLLQETNKVLDRLHGFDEQTRAPMSKHGLR